MSKRTIITHARTHARTYIHTHTHASAHSHTYTHICIAVADFPEERWASWNQRGCYLVWFHANMLLIFVYLAVRTEWETGLNDNTITTYKLWVVAAIPIVAKAALQLIELRARDKCTNHLSTCSGVIRKYVCVGSHDLTSHPAHCSRVIRKRHTQHVQFESAI
jgi:hypothetical protein